VLLLSQGCPGSIAGGTLLDSLQITSSSAFEPAAEPRGNAFVIKRGELVLEGGRA
jgi:hypothetical protein